MSARSLLSCVGAGLVLGVALPALAQKPTLAPSQMVSPGLLVTRIDTNCAVVRHAITTESAVEVVQRGSTWRVASVSDATVAERTHASVTYAKVWKQAGHYVWAQWITRDAQGNQHADQFCYRPDGSLARARHATTVPALDAVSVKVAYFNTDGSLIRKSATYVVDDPAVYKRVKDLPFFTTLP